jgi:signal peptidase
MRRAVRRGLARLCDLLAAVIILAALAWTGANLAVAASGGTLFVVAGGSMEPTVPRGSVAVVHPMTGAPDVGDAVTLRGSHGTYVTHRVVRVAELDGTRYLELKGDANASPDPVLVPASAAVGRVEVVVPFAGYVQLALARPAGWMAVLCGVVTLWLASALLTPAAGSANRGAVTADRPALAAGELGRWPT